MQDYLGRSWAKIILEMAKKADKRKDTSTIEAAQAALWRQLLGTQQPVVYLTHISLEIK